MGTPYLVANLILNECPIEALGSMAEAQKRVQLLVQEQKGSCSTMTNGDLFLVWPLTEQAKTFPRQVLKAALPEGGSVEDAGRYLAVYRLPEAYEALREKAEHYIGLSKTAALQVEEAPYKLLLGDVAQGPLTAWSVNQIERLLAEIDIGTFIRSQTVYEERGKGSLGAVFDERYISLQELKHAHFPRLDVTQPGHLFLDLCGILDQALLKNLAQNFDSIANRELSFNLSILTVLGVDFAQFTHRIPRQARHKIRFEIHCGDLMQDFAQTLAAFATLREEGYQITIDGVTPVMLPYINFEKFVPDYVKIDASKENLRGLRTEEFKRAAMGPLGAKIILFHCDSEQALSIGAALGLKKFQGWHVDALVSGRPL